MTPHALIAACRAAGVELEPDGDLILLDPPGKLPDALRAVVKAAKPLVLRVLRARAGLCSACGEPITAPPGTIPFRRTTAAGDLLHGRCWVGSFKPDTATPATNARQRPAPDHRPGGAA